MPFTMVAFLIASLLIIGLPPFGGVWSKWAISLGALDAGYVFAVAVLLISSPLNVAYLLPIVGRAFFKPLPADDGHNNHGHGHHENGKITEVPLACVVPLCITAFFCLLFFFPGELEAFIKMALTNSGAAQ